MLFKKQLVRKLEAYSGQFLILKERKELLDSLEKDKTEWTTWNAKMKAVLGNLSSADSLKFSALLVLIETNPKSELFHDQMKEFLIDRVQYWKHYAFKEKEKGLGKKEAASWIDKVFKLFTFKTKLFSIK